ncbi:stage II sporulation protein P [Heyndrickxia sporothermodurans]|uniref:stage II sporulation protein P n=1 Tax=Heyndrickxia sporothermodurans TaxID=46224 RepID=UPI002DB97A98|nr:stage II sporulation protein P [Heyndrickxia sporothermodurans]MEB6549589.1 stage II sporulation protein P [Heyndrickxia sporothermodurans]
MKKRTPFIVPFLLVAAILFISSLLTSVGSKYFTSSYVSQSIKNFSPENFVYLMGLEFSQVHEVLPEKSKPPKISAVVFNAATNLKPGDIRSLLGRELPGFYSYDAEIFFAGKGADFTNLPVESSPPLEEVLKDNEINEENIKSDVPETNKKKPKMTTNGRKVVYIYHTHSYESFKPLLKNGAVSSNNEKVNVVAVGKKLTEELEERGIGVVHDKTNMAEALHAKGWSTNDAYTLSRSMVASTLSRNKDITNIIDIHRDSQPRKLTTTKINGKSYAKVSIIVGKEVNNFEKNRSFALKFAKQMEKKYPGIMLHGVMIKGYNQGNGKYNQDLAKNAMLFEIGGVDNNLDELYRTTEAIADVYSEFYWEAEKVSAEQK